MSTIAELKSQIAAESDSNTLVALYEELVPMLQEPRVRYKDMTLQQKIDFRAKRKADRAAGIVRGKKLTEEQKAERAAKRTPEKIAATAAKRAASAEARVQKQLAMEAHVRELEALVANMNSGKRAK